MAIDIAELSPQPIDEPVVRPCIVEVLREVYGSVEPNEALAVLDFARTGLLAEADQHAKDGATYQSRLDELEKLRELQDYLRWSGNTRNAFLVYSGEKLEVDDEVPGALIPNGESRTVANPSQPQQQDRIWRGTTTKAAPVEAAGQTQTPAPAAESTAYLKLLSQREGLYRPRVSAFVSTVLSKVVESASPAEALEYLCKVGHRARYGISPESTAWQQQNGTTDDDSQPVEGLHDWQARLTREAAKGRIPIEQHPDYAAFQFKLNDLRKLGKIVYDIEANADVQGAIERHLLAACDEEQVSTAIATVPAVETSGRIRAIATAWETRRSVLLSKKGAGEAVEVTGDMLRLLMGQTAVREATTNRALARAADTRTVFEQARDGRPVNRKIRGSRKIERKCVGTRDYISNVHRLYQLPTPN